MRDPGAPFKEKAPMNRAGWLLPPRLGLRGALAGAGQFAYCRGSYRLHFGLLWACSRVGARVRDAERGGGLEDADWLPFSRLGRGSSVGTTTPLTRSRGSSIIDRLRGFQKRNADSE